MSDILCSKDVLSRDSISCEFHGGITFSLSSVFTGRQPLWPEALMRNYIVPAAKRAGITKPVNFHVFRRTFSTLLAANGEDVKTVQSLLRRANTTITFAIYTHAVNTKKREAHSKVVELVLPPGRKQPSVVTMGGTA